MRVEFYVSPGDAETIDFVFISLNFFLPNAGT